MRANYSYKLTSTQLTDTNPIYFLTPLMQMFYFGNTHDLAKIYEREGLLRSYPLQHPVSAWLGPRVWQTLSKCFTE